VKRPLGSRYHRAAYRAGASKSVIPAPRMAQTVSAMHAMQLLASGGVTMAAGAMISLSLAVSPPLTLPPRPAPVDVKDKPQRPGAVGVNGSVTSQQQRRARRPPRQVAVGVKGNVASQQYRPTETVGAAMADDFERRFQATDDMPLMPVPPRDLLAGLIGGTQIALHDLAAAPQPEQQEPVKVALNEPPTRPTDVCARRGLRRVEYTHNHHQHWRCAGRR
jgi:hypothetical protein